MRRGLLTALGAALCASSCAARYAVDAPIFEQVDAAGDVRLVHPSAPGISRQTFDLVALKMGPSGRYFIVEAVFAERVSQLEGVRLGDDRVADVYPQTVDVYLDAVPGEGQVRALPGREVHLSAAEAWDVVLLLSSLDTVREEGVVHPVHLISRGRSLIGVFDLADLPKPEAIRRGGAQALVLVTSPIGEGRVRPTSGHYGDCQSWDQERCRLVGEGPPVMDTLGDLAPGQPLALVYPAGQRPAPRTVPVVFESGGMVVAELGEGDTVEEGAFATILGEGGEALVTAVVVSIVDGKASLKVLGEGAKLAGAKSVVFGGVPPE